MTCPACRKDNPDDHKYCGACGAPLGGPAPSVDGPDRLRTLTILFSDLSGFTAMSEDMDPEDLDELVKALFAPLAECIQRHGGAVIKYAGDSIMAAFGMERSLEDDPVRACRAALAMQASIAQAAAEGNVPVKGMRIGLNTGPVKVTLIGGKPDVMGDAVNLASRLEQAAPVGGILMSRDTFRLVRGLFDAGEPFPLSVRGRSEPISVYLLKAERERGVRVGTRGVAGMETKMLGRDAELSQLKAAFDHVVRCRSPLLVTVTGEAGQGKSRLKHELLAFVEDLPFVVTWNEGPSFPVNPMPLYPLYRILCDKAGIKENEDLDSAKAKLEETVRRIMGDGRPEALAEQTHFLGELIGIEYPDSPFLSGIRGTDAEQVRMRGFMAISRLYEAMATHQPTVMVLEDCHWADEATIRLVEHLALTVKDVPLLILCIARPEFLARFPWFTAEGKGRRRIALGPLGISDRKDLIRHILRRCEVEPTELIDLIDERSEGNPFFVEELVRMLLDSGVLVRRANAEAEGGETWAVDASRLDARAVPTTVEGVIQARIDALPEAQRRVLVEAAVAGRVFWKELIAFDESGGDASALEDHLEEIEESLSALSAQDLIHPHLGSIFEGCEEHAFRHVLTGEVAYRLVLRRDKTSLHRLTAAWLEGKEADEPGRFSNLVAYHWERGEEPERAMRAYRMAGDRARADFHNEEALAHYASALRLLNRDGPAKDDALELAIRLAMCGPLQASGKRGPQRENLDRAIAAAEALGDGAGKASALQKLGAMLLDMGQGEAAAAASAEGLAIAESLGDAEIAASCLSQTAWVRALSGDLDEAGKLAERAFNEANASGSSTSQIDALNLLATIDLYRGGEADLCSALERYGQALDMAVRIRNKHKESLLRGNLGNTCLYLGRLEEAVSYLESALSLDRDTGHRLYEAYDLTTLATAHLRAGRTADAIRCAEEASILAKETGASDLEAELLNDVAVAWRLLGDVGRERAACESCLALRDPSFKDQYRQCLATFLLKGEKEALSAYRGIIEKHPSASAIRWQIAQLELLHRSPRAPSGIEGLIAFLEASLAKTR